MRQKELGYKIRKIHTRRHLAAQHLRLAIAALLAAQRQKLDPALCRELRRLWLEEMELAMHEGFVDYIQDSYNSMQRERFKLPWWNWEPDEFAQIERLRCWLKQQQATRQQQRREENKNSP